MQIGHFPSRFGVLLSAGLLCIGIVDCSVSADTADSSSPANRLPDAAGASDGQTSEPKADVHPFRYELTPLRRSGGREEPDPLTLTFALSPEQAKPGDTVTVSITADLEGKWHLFALTQNPENYGLPTKIEIERLNGLKPLDGAFQPNKKPEIEEPLGDGKTQEVYYGKITWSRRYEVLPATKAAGFGVAGQFKYQMCSNRCLPQWDVAFALGDLTESAAPPPAPDVAEKGAAEQTVSKPGRRKGVWIYLFGCFGVGLAAVLTPCFYPMIPITVGFFLKQGEEQRARPLFLASVYSATIVISFTIAGLVLGKALNQLGSGGVQNLVIGVLLVLFGMSLIGLFEIPIPQRLVRWSSAGEQKNQGRLLGVVFMALTLLIVGTPCIAPFWGPVLVGANDVPGLSVGNLNFALAAGALSFSLALALPFFVLALAPGMVGNLPKSGGWMNTVKMVMGFLLLGLSLIFLVKADRLWELDLFDRSGVLCLWTALALAAGLYLLGLLRSDHDTPAEGVSATRILSGTLFLAAALYLGSGLFQRLDAIEAFVPAGEPALAAAGASGEKLSFDELSYEQALAAGEKQGRPVFLDFTGESCVNCKQIERTVFTVPEIRDRLKTMVRAKLYTDRGTPGDEANKRLLGESFGVIGVPFYAVVGRGGKVLGQLAPRGPDYEDEIREFLDSALAETANQD